MEYLQHLNIDCGRGCTNCGAKRNRAKSSPEIVCLLRQHRESYERRKKLLDVLKINKTKPYELRITIL